MRPWPLPLIFLVGCSSLPSIADGIKTADSVGRGVARVLSWCEQNGATPGDVLKAVENVRRGDYEEALRLAFLIVQELRRQGVEVPSDQAAILQLASELQAARAIEQAARALAGRKPDGSEK